MQIFLGAICAYLFVVTFIGPEKHGVDFENAAVATESGAGKQKLGEYYDGEIMEKSMDKRVEKA